MSSPFPEGARGTVEVLLSRVLEDVDAGVREALAQGILAASGNASSLHDACTLLGGGGGPSERTLYRALRRLEVEAVEAAACERLRALALPHLPPKFAVSVDLTDIPYHGEWDRDARELVRSKAHQGTTWKHRYATAYVTHHGRRYTLVAHAVPKGETPTQALERVLDRLQGWDLLRRVTTLLADKGFYSVRALRHLKHRGVGFIVPMPAKANHIKKAIHTRRSHWTTHQVGHQHVDHEQVEVAIVHVPHRGKKGEDTFAYATHRVRGRPMQAHKRYLRRGGIETSYKLLNQARARTTTRNPATRLLLVTVSILLQNTWVTQKRHTPATPPTPTLTFRRFLRNLLYKILNLLPATPPQPGGNP